MTNPELSQSFNSDKMRNERHIVSAGMTDSALSRATLAEVRTSMRLSGEVHIDELPNLVISEPKHTEKKAEPSAVIGKEHHDKQASLEEIYNIFDELGVPSHGQDASKTHSQQASDHSTHQGHKPVSSIDSQMPWLGSAVDSQKQLIGPNMPWFDKPGDSHKPSLDKPLIDPNMPWIDGSVDSHKPSSDKPSIDPNMPSFSKPVDSAPKPPATNHDSSSAAHEAPAANHDTSTASNDKPAATQDSHAAPPEEQGIFGFFHKVVAVAEDIGSGIAHEIVDHPGKVLENVAVGAAVGVGATLLAPEIAIGAAIVGAGVGAYEIAKNAGKWAHSADVVANSGHYSAQEQAAAHTELHGVGEGITDLAAGFAGGTAASIGLKALSGAVASEAGAAANVGRISQSAAESNEAGAIKASPKAFCEQSESPAAPSVQSQEALPARPTTEAPMSPSEAPSTRIAANAPDEAARPVTEVPAQVAGDASHTESTLAKPVSIEAPNPCIRHYNVGDKSYPLFRPPSTAWYYGKYPEDGDIVGSIKVHVTVNGPEDLARVQKALIPWLKDDPAASELTTGWKTFDPMHAFGTGEPPSFVPGESGQNAKGFTLYTRNAEDAIKLQQQIDAELNKQGLGLKQPQDTGNVDIISGASNRVGIVRDYFPVTRDLSGNVGAKLDSQLTNQIEAEYAQGAKLTPSQLRAVEEHAGLRDGSLEYDKNGHLMLKLTKTGGGNHPGQVYVAESGASKAAGDLTDRPAIYALAHAFGWNPAVGAI